MADSRLRWSRSSLPARFWLGLLAALTLALAAAPAADAYVYWSNFGSGPGTMDHVVQSVGGDGGTCSSTTSQLCVGDADCPMGEMCDVTGGSFKLHFTITKRR